MWGAVLARAPGDLAGGAAGDIHRPDVIAAVAVGGEGDGLAIGRPGRVAVVILAMGELARVAAIGAHGPQIIVAVAIGVIGQARAIRRPDGQMGIVEIVGDASGFPAFGRDDPQAALQVEGQPLPIGGDGDGIGGASMHIEGLCLAHAGRRRIGGSGMRGEGS
jgi:hypothetical protein